MGHSSPDRRTFMTGLSLAATAIPLVGNSRASLQSPNDRPNVGCIGVGGMGQGDLKDHKNHANIVAVCDVDSRHAEAAKNDPEMGDGKPDVYSDYREILDRSDINVVSIVTPDHWHTKMAIEALQAGKHVFCQKPLTLTLEENQLIRAAVEKYSDRVFLVGTQQRSSKNLFLRAVNMVHKGLLGDIKRITCGINGGAVGGPFDVAEIPKELDWDAWLGQAPMTDYIPQRCHGNFRWWYEYSGGKFTDWGAHHIDIALWALNRNNPGDGPIEIDGTDANHPVAFSDGMPTETNRYNTAHDYSVVCRFADEVELVVDSRSDNGLLIEGEKGRIFVNRQKITGTPIEENWDDGKYGDEDLVELYKGKPFEWHKNNFYRCIREGGLPVSDVYTHLQAMNVCHLSAIAARLNRVVKWDPKAEQILGDELAASLFSRTPRPGFEIPRV